MVARMGLLLGGGDFAAEAGALFFCKRKNAQKAPLAGSGVFCAFILYGDGLKKDGLSLCVRALRVYGCGAWGVNPFVRIFLGNVEVSLL